MSIHLADAEVPLSVRVRTASSPVLPTYHPIEAEEHDRLAVARGIVGAMIISIPFWTLVGFAFYLLT